MPENSEVLDYLRAQFARQDAKMDRLASDVTEVKQRITALEIQIGRLIRDRETRFIAYAG